MDDGDDGVDGVDVVVTLAYGGDVPVLGETTSTSAGELQA